MRNRYEMNPLSMIEGGSRIKITFKNGVEKEYENIKDVSAYVAKVLSESDYMINRIEMEKEVVTKEWKPLFGRTHALGRNGTSQLESYNQPEI
jgi:hypothetical protein